MRAIDGDALLKKVQQEKIQAQVYGREFSTCFLSPGGTPSTEWWYVEDLIENAPTIEPEIKEIGYQDCSNAALKMWIDNVLTDGEYNRIMDKLNAHWEKTENG